MWAEINKYINSFKGTRSHKGAALRKAHRDIFHACITCLLDADFLDAVVNWIIVVCGDGVTPCLFFHLYTYSADYPEKSDLSAFSIPASTNFMLLSMLCPPSARMLIATCRQNGAFPCSRCLVPKAKISHLGTPGDLTQRKLKRVDNAGRQSNIQLAVTCMKLASQT